MKRLAILGNHLPRQCGIATFTTHLADALTTAVPDVDSFVLAMNDAGRRHPYPARVRFEIAEGDPGSYERAADYLNVNQVDVLSVQHEYGIFGGKAGAHVLTLLRELRMPIVTTLHTVLSAPNPAQRAVIEELARLSERLVVMSASGADLLTRVHGISRDQIDLIHTSARATSATSRFRAATRSGTTAMSSTSTTGRRTRASRWRPAASANCSIGWIGMGRRRSHPAAHVDCAPPQRFGHEQGISPMDPHEIQARATIAAALVMTRAVEIPTIPMRGDWSQDTAAMRLRDLTDYVYQMITSPQPR